MISALRLILFWGTFVATFFVPTLLPVLPEGEPRARRYALAVILFGICAGPLAILSMRDAGYGGLIGMVFYAFVLPALAAGLARSRRPLLFGLLGNLGYVIGWEVVYVCGSPWERDPDWPGICLLILGLNAFAAFVACLPFFILVRRRRLVDKA